MRRASPCSGTRTRQVSVCGLAIRARAIAAVTTAPPGSSSTTERGTPRAACSTSEMPRKKAGKVGTEAGRIEPLRGRTNQNYTHTPELVFSERTAYALLALQPTRHFRARTEAKLCLGAPSRSLITSETFASIRVPANGLHAPLASAPLIGKFHLSEISKETDHEHQHPHHQEDGPPPR